MLFSRKPKSPPAGPVSSASAAATQAAVANVAKDPTSAALTTAATQATAALASHAAPIAPAPAAPTQSPIASGTAATAAAGPASGLAHDDARQRSQLSMRSSASYGSIVRVFARSRHYQNMPLGELRYIAMPPMVTGQYMVADGQMDPASPNGRFGPVAVVTWALVNADIDRQLLTDPAAGMRLTPQQWKSGDNVWIIDAAGRKPSVDRLVAHLLANEFKGKIVKIRMRDEAGKITAGQYPAS